MSKTRVVNIAGNQTVKKIAVADIPVKALRTARSALAEDIVIAEIAIADESVFSGKDSSGKIERLRADIDSLGKLDTFLQEIEP